MYRFMIGCTIAAALLVGCSADRDFAFDVSFDAPSDAAEVDAAADLPEVVDVHDAPEVLDAAEAADPPADDGVRDTIGMMCANDEECQNGLYCDGAEICPYGFCRTGPLPDCSDGVNCTLDTCVEETDSCDHEVDDSACDDSNPCTTDTCEVSTDTCLNEPIDCSDGVNCTLDTCDTSTGACEHTIADEACDDADACTIDTCEVSTDTCFNTLIDGDGDLHPPESCGGDDCDDTNPTVYTGATEICGDGIDQDCDGTDGDMGTCGCPEPITSNGTITGTTSGTSVHRGTCAGSGPEWVFQVTPSRSRSVTFETVSTSWDTVLYVRNAPCATGTQLGCDDDGGSGVLSRLNVSLTSGTTYYVFVDGFGSSSSGSFTLDVSGL
jgi:hypothetical protein